MHKRITNLLLLATLAVGIMVTGYVGTAMAGKAGPSANGNTIALDVFTGEPIIQAFHARELKNGTVIGSLERKRVMTDGESFRFHADIDCLLIVDDTAHMSGEITHDEPFGPGLKFIAFAVTDNGEGANDPPDLTSFLFISESPIDCEDMIAVPVLEVVKGNAKVKP